VRHPPFFQFCSAKREIRVVFGVSQPLVHCIGETPLRLFATCVGYRRLQSASRVSHVFYSVLPPYGDTGRERYWSPLARRLSNRACRNCEFSCLNRSHSQRHRSHSAASQSSVLRCASRTTCRRNAGCCSWRSVIGRKATTSRALVNGCKSPIRSRMPQDALDHYTGAPPPLAARPGRQSGAPTGTGAIYRLAASQSGTPLPVYLSTKPLDTPAGIVYGPVMRPSAETHKTLCRRAPAAPCCNLGGVRRC